MSVEHDKEYRESREPATSNLEWKKNPTNIRKHTEYLNNSLSRTQACPLKIPEFRYSRLPESVTGTVQVSHFTLFLLQKNSSSSRVAVHQELSMLTPELSSDRLGHTEETSRDEHTPIIPSSFL